MFEILKPYNQLSLDKFKVLRKAKEEVVASYSNDENTKRGALTD
jgi:hypothetical protein